MKPCIPERRLANLVEEFFLDRLIRQRNSSPQTVAAYRDCFRLVVEFARDHRKTPTERFVLADLDAPFVLVPWITWRRLVKTPSGAVTPVWRLFALSYVSPRSKIRSRSR